jgi:hypothetical protein
MFNLWRDRAARHERKCRDAYNAVQEEKQTFMDAEETGMSYEAYLGRQTTKLFGPGRMRTGRRAQSNTRWLLKQKQRQAELAQEYIDRYLDDDDAA